MPHRYTAGVEWSRRGEAFVDGRYSRAHLWAFDEGVTVPASASPLHVRAPMSRADAVDPEEAFVAALSSCHMLFFLQGAARAGHVVESYRDRPVGTMGRDADGREHLAEVRLSPVVTFADATAPDRAALAQLHRDAHHSCYLANSVRSAVVIDGLDGGH